MTFNFGAKLTREQKLYRIMASVFLLYKNEMSAKRSGIQNRSRQVCCIL